MSSASADLDATVNHIVARIARLNPVWRAFSHLAPDARAQADAAAERGPLHGRTASIKGCVPVAGLPWTEGSALHADRVAARDAEVVTRLRQAGAVILGTTTLSEMAMYGVINPFEPMGLNPWDPERTAGGSSTGAGVAAALGLADINIGTDSGGSVRNPACHCGVVGFMPSIEAIPGDGIPNHAPSVGAVGVITRTVADAALAFDVLSRAPVKPAATGAKPPGRRLLVLQPLVDRMCDDATRALFADARRRLVDAGFTLVDADIEGWTAGERAAGIVSLHECGRALAAMDLARASDGLRQRAANAAKLTPADVANARAACEALRLAVTRALDDAQADAIASPTWPFAAPPIAADTVVVQGRTVPLDPHRNCFVRAANAIDACAITIPMGLYPDAQVPAGLHLLAPGGSERRLLAVAALAEAAMPRLPPPPPLR